MLFTIRSGDFTPRLMGIHDNGVLYFTAPLSKWDAVFLPEKGPVRRILKLKNPTAPKFSMALDMAADFEHSAVIAFIPDAEYYSDQQPPLLQ